jgi:4-cresol dehydrogenase (hydroxylating)
MREESDPRQCSPANVEFISNAAIIKEAYQRNISGILRSIPLVVLPTSEQDVAAVVHQAIKLGWKLYPISIGRNWGLGSKLPVQDGCVVMDLSRMNRILEVNESGRYAVIEPGVTQGQLATYLRQYHPAFTMNITGSFAETSVLGNVLDRGDGIYARIDDLLGVRGILGDGTGYEVGGQWGSAQKVKDPSLLRYGAGPDLVGVFSQSNFAVTTSIAFRIMKRPERRYLIWGHVGNERLAALMDQLDYLGDQSLFRRASVNVGYANRFVQAQSSMMQRVQTAKPTQEENLWQFWLIIDGTHRSADCCAGEVTTSLKGFCDLIGSYRSFPDPPTIESLPRCFWPLIKPIQGIPDDESIKSIYLLTKTTLPKALAEMDVDHTPFGMRSLVFSISPTGSSVREAADIITRVKYRFQMNIRPSFFGDGRALITIHFRTDQPELVRAAESAEAALWEGLISAGYLPYRSSVNQMEKTIGARPSFFALVSKMKAALDPDNVIAPGRYCPVMQEKE